MVSINSAVVKVEWEWLSETSVQVLELQDKFKLVFTVPGQIFQFTLA